MIIQSLFLLLDDDVKCQFVVVQRHRLHTVTKAGCFVPSESRTAHTLISKYQTDPQCV